MNKTLIILLSIISFNTYIITMNINQEILNQNNQDDNKGLEYLEKPDDDKEELERLNEERFRYAIKNNKIDRVKKLIASGANVNARDFMDTPLLLHAVIRNRKDIVKLLIDAGAMVNIMDRNGITPLHYAADYGYKETVELLLNNGADKNIEFNNKTAADVAKTQEIKDIINNHSGMNIAVR